MNTKKVKKPTSKNTAPATITSTNSNRKIGLVEGKKTNTAVADNASKPVTVTPTKSNDETRSGEANSIKTADKAPKRVTVTEKPVADSSDTERPDTKPVPILDRKDAVVSPPSPNRTPPKDVPTMFKKPLLVMTKPSLDHGDDEESYRYIEGDDAGRPTEFQPRVRRVSDVIDSVGERNSLPSSPRVTTFPGGFSSVSLPSTPRLPQSFAPDWLMRHAESTATRASDATDGVTLRKKENDSTDAAPMNSSSFSPFPDEDENMPTSVWANLSVEKDSHEYNMSHPRRGRAVIFNHDSFDAAGFSSRPGSDVDAKNLEQTLTELHFEVAVFHNLEHSEIKAVINQLKAEDHSEADCLLVTVLTHGMQGGYVLSKDVPYPVDYLWHSFKADVCPTLAGKPKLFFIQACRGEALDAGVHMMRSRTQTDSASAEYKLPSFSDFLVAHGTMDGHFAFRNPETGTWFIECLCRELRESGTTVDLLRLLTRTARRVAVDYCSFNDLIPWQSDMKQVPSITTMLIREVYFRPKGGVAAQSGDLTAGD